jgi:hypothetical protein
MKKTKVLALTIGIIFLAEISLALKSIYQTGYCIDIPENQGGDADILCDDFVLRTQDNTQVIEYRAYIDPTGPIVDPEQCEGKECNATIKLALQIIN